MCVWIGFIYEPLKSFLNYKLASIKALKSISQQTVFDEQTSYVKLHIHFGNSPFQHFAIKQMKNRLKNHKCHSLICHRYEMNSMGIWLNLSHFGPQVNLNRFFHAINCHGMGIMQPYVAYTLFQFEIYQFCSTIAINIKRIYTFLRIL